MIESLNLALRSGVSCIVWCPQACTRSPQPHSLTPLISHSIPFRRPFYQPTHAPSCHALLRPYIHTLTCFPVYSRISVHHSASDASTNACAAVLFPGRRRSRHHGQRPTHSAMSRAAERGERPAPMHSYSHQYLHSGNAMISASC